MSKVLAVSEYYNEADNIPGLVENLNEQTMKPDLYLLIDDGSTDNSTEIFQKYLERAGFDSILYTMPPKAKPDANLKGRAYTNVDILNSDWFDKNDYDYLLKIDVDTRFPKTYIELSKKIMDRFPIFGTMSGRIHGEPGSPTPMGTGKMVRSNVLKRTRDRYWDLDPDSLWNLIALGMGCRMLIPKDLLVSVTRPTHMYATRGLYDFGRRMCYVGWKPQNAIFYAMSLLAGRNQPQHFLKGYIHAYMEKDWRLRDSEVYDYFGFSRMLRRGLRISHQRDFATVLNIGMKPQYEDEISHDFLQQVFSKIQVAIK